jgi:Redoxin
VLNSSLSAAADLRRYALRLQVEEVIANQSVSIRYVADIKSHMNKLTELPQDLPIPVDDGACNHLLGIPLPSITLPSTQGECVDLSAIAGRIVVYCYPMTGQPGVSLPDGWDAIPGARGCTPQSCAFRDHYQELNELGASVFGLSTQSTDYQLETKTRLHLPFEL